MIRTALLVAVATAFLAGCAGTVIVAEDEGPSPAGGALYCPLEEDGCPPGDGVPGSAIILEPDAGAGEHEALERCAP